MIIHELFHCLNNDKASDFFLLLNQVKTGRTLPGDVLLIPQEQYIPHLYLHIY